MTELHLNAGLLQVAHGDHRAVARFDHHVVASQLRPTRCCPAALGEGIADGRQPTEGMVIRCRVVHADDDALDGREDEAPEARNRPAGSGRRSDLNVIGAVRPASLTGTKSIANDVANRVVPWLGSRFAGLFWVSHRPSNG